MSLRAIVSRGVGRCCLLPPKQWVPSSCLVPGSTTLAIRTFASKKHKNLLKHAKGFRGRSKNCFSIAIRRVQKSWQYGYRDRRVKRREWHKLWIQRISAGVRQYSMSYSRFYANYRKTGLRMDRKILSDLAATEPFAFRSVVQVVKHESPAKL